MYSLNDPTFAAAAAVRRADMLSSGGEPDAAAAWREAELEWLKIAAAAPSLELAAAAEHEARAVRVAATASRL